MYNEAAAPPRLGQRPLLLADPSCVHTLKSRKIYPDGYLVCLTSYSWGGCPLFDWAFLDDALPMTNGSSHAARNRQMDGQAVSRV
jgi:hypothetical protein